MIPIVEATSVIRIKSDQELTKTQIRYALMSAQATCHYAKFYTDRYFITVLYNRDGTVNISTNYRFNTLFDNQLYWLTRNGYQLALYVDFIYRWINYIRKTAKF